MNLSHLSRPSISPGASTAAAVSTFQIDEFDEDRQRVMLPRPEIQIIVRAGSMVKTGLDVHVCGPQQTVRRKLVRSGHWMVAARLRLGASVAVLGIPASHLAGRIVPLEDLWDAGPVRRLLDRLSHAASGESAGILEQAIAERLTTAHTNQKHATIALQAAGRLESASVRSVAADLGVSERHLRRIFRDAVGVSPKYFAQLSRFQRALRAARAEGCDNWADVAAATGYYDQAHLIDEFRAIAGVTPRALLNELA